MRETEIANKRNREKMTRDIKIIIDIEIVR